MIAYKDLSQLERKYRTTNTPCTRVLTWLLSMLADDDPIAPIDTFSLPPPAPYAHPPSKMSDENEELISYSDDENLPDVAPLASPGPNTSLNEELFGAEDTNNPDTPSPMQVDARTATTAGHQQKLDAINSTLQNFYDQPDPDDALDKAIAKANERGAKIRALRKQLEDQAAAFQQTREKDAEAHRRALEERDSAIGKYNAEIALLRMNNKILKEQRAAAQSTYKRAHAEIEDSDSDSPRGPPSSRSSTSAPLATATPATPAEGGRKGKERAYAPVRPDVSTQEGQKFNNHQTSTPRTSQKTAAPKNEAPKAPPKQPLAHRISEKPSLVDRIAERISTVKQEKKAQMPAGGNPNDVFDLRFLSTAAYLHKVPREFLPRYGLRLIGGRFLEAPVSAFNTCRSTTKSHLGRILFCIVAGDPERYQQEYGLAPRNKYTFTRFDPNNTSTVEGMRAHLIASGVDPKDMRNARPWAMEVLANVDQSDSYIPSHIKEDVQRTLDVLLNDPHGSTVPFPGFKSARYYASIERYKAISKNEDDPVDIYANGNIPSAPGIDDIDTFLASGDEAGAPKPKSKPKAKSTTPRTPRNKTTAASSSKGRKTAGEGA